MSYVNPANGGWAMPTIATWMQLLPKGFATTPYRSTDGAVFVAVEGTGKTPGRRQVLRWGPHDVFVVPSWHAGTATRAQTKRCCSASPTASVQEKLGFFREQRGNA